MTVESARADKADVLVPAAEPELSLSVLKESRQLCSSAKYMPYSYSVLVTQARPIYDEHVEACAEVVGKYRTPVPPVRTGVVT